MKAFLTCSFLFQIMPIQEIIEHVFGNEFLQDLKCNVQSKNPEETIGEE